MLSYHFYKYLMLFLILSFNSSFLTAQKKDELPLTPPMGWNSWNAFGEKINESNILETIDLFEWLNLKDFGYEYIVLDDGWMANERDSLGNLYPDPIKFPNGLKPLIEYAHAKGLKFGLYACAGNKTCAGYPGSYGFEKEDAHYFSNLRIDFLKYDWCHTKGLDAKKTYKKMGDALKQSDHKILFSICEWGHNFPWLWASEIGIMWRISGDLYPCFKCENIHKEGWKQRGVIGVLELREKIRQYSGAGHWNDFDMLQVGNNLTFNENKSHFTLWSMMSSPLFIGSDLNKMSSRTIKILTNKEIITINQDNLGIQGFKYKEIKGISIWVKPLSEKKWAISFLNLNTHTVKFEFDWSKHHFKDPDFEFEADFSSTTYKIRDVWKHKFTNSTEKKLKIRIPENGIVTYVLIPENY